MQQQEIKRFDMFSFRDFTQPFKPMPMHAHKPDVFEPVDVPPPPPTFSEAELAAAKREAHAEGVREGERIGGEREKSANAQREQALIQMLDGLVEQVSLFAGQQRYLLEQKQQEMTSLAVAISQHVTGCELSVQPALLAASLVERTLPYLVQEPQVELVVNPDLADLMQEKLAAIDAAKKLNGRLQVQGNPAFGLYDCRIDWEGGHASIELEQLWRAVMQQCAATPLPVIETIQPDTEVVQHLDELAPTYLADASDALTDASLSTDIPELPEHKDNNPE